MNGMPGGEHECCDCYSRKVPADLRAVLDWLDQFKAAAELMKAKKVTPEQFAYYCTTGNPFPTPAPKEDR